ncbi:DMT family transporter [Mariniflexile ostreae]|uniref:DMT family transporter n=1 Tax=Mariniflexile ostreae TaxID=1520892 RepID=A0ABV5FDY3_9FLAO
MDIRKAVLFMLVSTFSLACMNASVKYLTNISAYQIVFFRSVGSLFFTFGFLFKNKISILGNNKKLLILRGLVGVTSMTLFFMSTKYLPIGTAVSLRYLSPIFAAIFAVYFLKDRIKHVQWLFFLMAFVGVLVLKGLDTQVNGYGLILILISGVFNGLVYVVISKIGKSEHPVVIVNYFMVIATLVGGVLSIGNWVTPEGWEWVTLFSLGIFGYVGQVYMTKAFQIARTTQVAPLSYFEVIFTVLFGLFIFNELYTLWSVLGIAIIICALLLNNIYKNKSNP